MGGDMYVDYVVDETLRRKTNNELIDPDTGEPNPELTHLAECALAEVAAVLHRNTDKLSTAQLEQVAGWAKKLKLRERSESRQTRDFSMVLIQLRESSEQNALQSKSIKKSLMAIFFGACGLGLMGCAAVAIWAFDVGWATRSVLAVLTLAAFWYADVSLKDGLVIAKEQDRRYAMNSLRAARNVEELNEAGLFAYMPHTRYDEPGFDEKKAHRLMRAEVERLTDSLYMDPELWLQRYEYSWNYRDHG